MPGAAPDTSADPDHAAPAESSTTAQLTQTFTAGSLIIPMDTSFQDSGTLEVYGLVYQLLANNVPVQWAISPAKAVNGNDFTVAAPAVVHDREAGTNIGLPVSYRGGPFIIDSADRAAALPIVDAWLAAHTTVTHDLISGTFTAPIARTLNAAPRIAVLQDGFEAIAIADFNAAGIPDSTGQAWNATTSPDVLSEAAVAGPTTTSHTDGGLWNADGTPKYCALTSMHYNPTAATPEVVAEVRGWLTGQPGNHAFMQCQASVTFESGHMLTTNGLVDDGNTPTNVTDHLPSDFLTQTDVNFVADTGQVDSIGLAAGSTFVPGVRQLLSQSGAATNTRLVMLGGRVDGLTANGEVTYLAGHDYFANNQTVPGTPLSTHPLTSGVKAMLDGIFEAGCASAATGGQPNVKLTKSGPATVSGNQITYTIAFANTGSGIAEAASITDAIPPGSTFASASNGGTFAGGVVTWSIGNLAIGAAGNVTVTVGVTSNGTFANTAAGKFKIGVSTKTVTSNTVTTTRNAQPPDTEFTQTPTNPSDDQHPTFTFDSPGLPTATFECSLDGAAFAPCASPDAIGPLALGDHTFAVRAVDPATGLVDPTPATFTWRVNDTPHAVDDTAATDRNAPVTIPVLANDTGLGDAPISLATTAPAHGTVQVTADNQVTYTPDPGFAGTDTFTYTVTDKDGQTSTATVTVSVAATNRPPVTNPDTATTTEGTAVDVNVLANDSDPDGDPLTVTAVTQPNGGTASINPDGTVHFAPNPGFVGTATITYTASDGKGGIALATLTVTVTAPVDQPPIANEDTATTNGQAIDIPVLANDSDPDGDPLTVISVSSPGTGTVTINPDGTLHYTPDPTYVGSVTFTYTVSDGKGGTATAFVTITVNQGIANNGGGNGFNDGVGISGGGCNTGGGAGGLGAGLGALGALAMVGRRRRRAWAIFGTALAALAALFVPRAAQAQVMEPANFGVERFQLSSDGDGMFSVESGEVQGNWALSASLWAGYANDPLVAYQGTRDNRVGELVANRASGALSISLSPSRWFALTVDLPLVVYQNRPANSGISTMSLDSLNSFGTSDLRVSPKIALLHQADHGVSLSVIPTLVLPTRSTSDAYFDDAGFAFIPELALSRHWTGWRMGINAGYHMRKRAEFLNQVVDDEFFASAAVGYQFADRGGPPVGIDVTIDGATAARAPFSNFNENALETLAGLTYDIKGGAQVFGGAGIGLQKGYGTPDWRGLAGLRFGFGGQKPQPAARPPVIDSDGDGIVDTEDKCPDQPEDKDGFEDQDGCPDPDNDKDGVLDKDDRCINTPGPAALAGCPDTDGDGIADIDDKCPNEPEDKDGFEDADGCPDPDNDKDGVLDVADACPMEAGPAANHGCPDKDKDGDGIVDRLDNCPDEPGPAENNGCPKKQLVKITDDNLEIIDSVYFKTDRAEILPRSFPLLDNVVAVLQSHDKLHIQVEGHTDSQGKPEYNKQLSQRRADSVVQYLVKKGISIDRLTSVGFGQDKPIADNATAAGRAHNRRVVFTVLGDDGHVKTRVQGAGADTK